MSFNNFSFDTTVIVSPENLSSSRPVDQSDTNTQGTVDPRLLNKLPTRETSNQSQVTDQILTQPIFHAPRRSVDHDLIASFAFVNVQSSKDIPRMYDKLLQLYGVHDISCPESGEALHRLWNIATDYARSLCDEICEVWCSAPLLQRTRNWSKILNNPGWPIYAKQHLPEPDCFYASYIYGSASFSRRLESRLRELTATKEKLDWLRLSCISHWLIDPAEEVANCRIIFHFTSDSNDIDSDYDPQYQRMLRDFEKFREDENRVFYKTEPILRRRMRKDLRAWVRLARYSCIKLSCNSMFIHKEQQKLPRRVRAPQLDYDHGSQAVPDPVQGTVIWEPRESAVWHSSDSMDSMGSSYSATFGRSKRRLPRNRDGYKCTFLECGKTFNRQCDLSHHQRSHRSREELPYPCESCEKRFPFPKDLRRHEKSCQSRGTSGDH